jgi:AcrR family transcriptional regulator
MMKAKDSYHHGDLRHEIIEEAKIWIETKDISSLSLREIARRLGVSHNAPYRHFADKESLLAAIAQMGFEKLRQWLQQIVEDNILTPEEQIKALGVKYIEYALSNPAYYRVMYSAYLSDYQKYPSLDKAAEESFTILIETIAQGQKVGVIRAGDTRELAYVCWSLVHGVSMLHLDRQLRSPEVESVEKLAKLATAMMIEGLAVKK